MIRPPQPSLAEPMGRLVSSLPESLAQRQNPKRETKHQGAVRKQPPDFICSHLEQLFSHLFDFFIYCIVYTWDTGEVQSMGCTWNKMQFSTIAAQLISLCYLTNERALLHTAELIDIHRTTLLYRIRRIEELTGLDLLLSFHLIFQ